MMMAFAFICTTAFSTNYSLWIHGRKSSQDTTATGTYSNFASYWGPASASAGVNKIAVNWDGYSHISTQNSVIRNALDCYCTGDNWCYVAAHSAGDLQIGYALSLYGSSTRNVKTPSPASNGTCSNVSSGATQTGWNIKFVDIAAGAGGGSELADVGSWTTSSGLVQDLKTTTARALYDHNITQGVWFNMYAGAKGTLYSAILPGQDDEAVAYHSAGGVAGSAGRSLCNPGDWFCSNLTTGTSANQDGSTKWSYHSVAFRDTSESYNHYTNQNWEGVVSLVRAHMASNAL
ncbi:hypothetical protein KIK84_14570 [Curvibacter sp. CHRR-16]|nr:hypothetical protein [Curvibacter sp. CHRR-16]